MPKRAGLSLSVKIIGTATLAIVLLLTIGIYLLNRAQSRATLRQQEQQIQQTAELTARAIEIIMPTGDPQSVTAFIRPAGTRGGEHAVRVSILKPSGEIKWDTEATGEGRTIDLVQSGALVRDGAFYSLTRKLVASEICLSCHDVKIGGTIGFVRILTPSGPSEALVGAARDRLAIFGFIQVLALATLIGLLMRYLIIGPLQRFIASLRSGQNDLTRRLPQDGGDEIADLAAAFNHFLSLLDELVGTIRKATGQVTQEAGVVARISQGVSDGTGQQAASIDQSASALEELSATVRHNAEHAEEGQRLANQSRGLVEAGAPVVQEAVKAMHAVDSSAKQIELIIGTIESIASQTNILALNASVEAARAGEHGRGFAVVAAEVRRLSLSTSAAAREVKQIVTTAMEKIDGGLKLVTRSGRNLEEILRAVQRLDQIVTAISQASKEQSTGLDEVNTGVQLVQRSTNDIADESNKLAENSQALTDVAAQLQGLVAKFKVTLVN
jgi:methyl-accepting chemotaxis protein